MLQDNNIRDLASTCAVVDNRYRLQLVAQSTVEPIDGIYMDRGGMFAYGPDSLFNGCSYFIVGANPNQAKSTYHLREAVFDMLGQIPYSLEALAETREFIDERFPCTEIIGVKRKTPEGILDGRDAVYDSETKTIHLSGKAACYLRNWNRKGKPWLSLPTPNTTPDDFTGPIQVSEEVANYLTRCNAQNKPWLSLPPKRKQ